MWCLDQATHASPGSLLGMQKLRPHPVPLDQNLQTSGCCRCRWSGITWRTTVLEPLRDSTHLENPPGHLPVGVGEAVRGFHFLFGRRDQHTWGGKLPSHSLLQLLLRTSYPKALPQLPLSSHLLRPACLPPGFPARVVRHMGSHLVITTWSRQTRTGDIR